MSLEKIQFLGETPIEQKDTIYANSTPIELALLYIQLYGGIDGSYHKDWVLDQVARLLNGAPLVNLRLAKWSDGDSELRHSIGTNEAYDLWVSTCRGELIDGEYEYSYELGIAP